VFLHSPVVVEPAVEVGGEIAFHIGEVVVIKDKFSQTPPSLIGRNFIHLIPDHNNPVAGGGHRIFPVHQKYRDGVIPIDPSHYDSEPVGDPHTRAELVNVNGQALTRSHTVTVWVSSNEPRDPIDMGINLAS